MIDRCAYTNRLRSVVRDWATWVVVMENGRAAFAGPSQTLLGDRKLLEGTGLSQVWRLEAM